MEKKEELNKEKTWLFEINAKHKLIDFNFKETWRYRYLIWLFVKRDVVTLYKQSILGPLWYLIQPLFTMVIFTVIFNKVANINTMGIPAYLFNLAGIIVWNYFREVLVAVSDTYKQNEAIFGKVYFPRIIIPLAIVFSNLFKFFIQFFIFIAFYLYFYLGTSFDILPNIKIIYFPLLILEMGLMSLGLGMIFSSMVIKYRDLKFLLTFGVQLLMYISAVFYPLAIVKDTMKSYYSIVWYNPIAHIIELTRNILFNQENISVFSVIYPALFTVIVLFSGIVIFNKAEKTFIDTI